MFEIDISMTDGDLGHPHLDDHRYIRFSISNNMFSKKDTSYLMVLKKLFSFGIIITNCEHNYAGNYTTYYGWHEKFPVIPEHISIPEYKVIVVEDFKDNTIIITRLYFEPTCPNTPIIEMI